MFASVACPTTADQAVFIFGGTSSTDYAGMFRYHYSSNEFAYVAGYNLPATPGSAGAVSNYGNTWYPAARYNMATASDSQGIICMLRHKTHVVFSRSEQGYTVELTSEALFTCSTTCGALSLLLARINTILL